MHEVPQELPGAHVERSRIAYQVRTWFGKSHEEMLRPVRPFMEIGEDLALQETNVADTVEMARRTS